MVMSWFGGYSWPEGTLSSCLSWQPGQQEWVAAPSLGVERDGAAAAVVGGVGLVVAGGRGHSSTEVYDGTHWNPGPDMGGRVLLSHCVSAAPDKGLLVTGGATPLPYWQLNINEKRVTQEDIYVTDESFVLSLETGVVNMVASMQHARAEHACASTDLGHVVAGGHDGVAVLDSVEVLYPGAQSWEPLEPLPKPRYKLTAVHSYLDTLVIVGGKGEETKVNKEDTVQGEEGMEVLKYVASERRWEQWEAFTSTKRDLVTVNIDVPYSENNT